MSFDQFPYRRIPIWENRRRAKVLKKFRVLIIDYVNSRNREVLRSINELMPGVREMSRLAGISFEISDALRGRIVEMGFGVPRDYDLLDDVSAFLHPDFQNQLIDLIDRAIGAYDHNKHIAWENTLNPFYWLRIVFNPIAEALLRTLADFGVDAAAEPNSRFSRIVRRVLGFVLFVFVPVVFTYLDFLGLKKWFFELLGRLKW